MAEKRDDGVTLDEERVMLPVGGLRDSLHDTVFVSKTENDLELLSGEVDEMVCVTYE